MRLKEFIGATEAEAIERVRAEWGDRAIILSSRRERPGGLFGWFRRKTVVVVAAYDGEPEGGALAPVPSGTDERATDDRLTGPGGAGSRVSAVRAAVMRDADGGLLEARRTALLEILEQSRRRTERAAIDGAPSVPFAAKVRPSPARSPGGGKDERSEATPAHESPDETLVMLRTALEGVFDGRRGPYVRAFWPLADALRAHGVEPRWIGKLHDAVLRRRPEAAADAAKMRQAAAHMLTGWLRRKVGVPKRAPRLIVLVGPTGVGKTTTAAKLSARLTLQGDGKTALITADTYRIAAVEQLRTYAEIMDVPFAVVYTPEEAEARARRALGEGRTVFVDTAGRNYRDDVTLSELRPYVERLIGLDASALPLLTLALTHTWEDNARLIERFLPLGVDALVFTKYDEAARLGQIINAALRYPVRAVYVTDGQNVPDDLRALDAEWLVRTAVGGDAS
ncbi:MAG: flagellar biosynthesis protein FlhF [Hydrogenibacillus sp.]|nr:flagellar biosynthesis protein FlhF [Hydrogenibacillus sp.]